MGVPPAVRRRQIPSNEAITPMVEESSCESAANSALLLAEWSPPKTSNGLASWRSEIVSSACAHSSEYLVQRTAD